MGSAGFLIFLGLGVLAYFKQQYLAFASWVLVLCLTGYSLVAIYFINVRIINMVWIVIPYFLSMFLLGLRSGGIISLIFFIGILSAILLRFGNGFDAMPVLT